MRIQFHGVRLFSYTPPIPDIDRYKASIYDVKLSVNVNDIRSCTRTGTYRLQQTQNQGFDVMFESPILMQGNDVVNMDAAILGYPSAYGRCGKFTVKKGGVTERQLLAIIYFNRDCGRSAIEGN